MTDVHEGFGQDATGLPITPNLRVIEGGVVLLEPVTADPWEFRADFVEAFVASWRARGFSLVRVENDIDLLERTLNALGRPARDVPRRISTPRRRRPGPRFVG
ncbi:hypothetical protein ACF06Q_27945 [Streptomyces leeuwenhoekii]|uniref:hypothetical protein n=1 Tax=Streptomyces leeuwenhoekii TaxID=1437453 RepID=UPI00370079E6